MSDDNSNDKAMMEVNNSNSNSKDTAPECTGAARTALELFRKRQAELERVGQKKPDMVAFKELSGQHTPPRKHGSLDGVPVGLSLKGRGEAAILGIHQLMLSGIDARKDTPCYAICCSGGYGDDNDNQEDGTLVYTGAGGQNKQRRQVKDQSESNAGNASLIRSYETQCPIRVLRGRASRGKNQPAQYYYDGLYQCTNYAKVPSVDGPLVLKFTLKPIANESVKARSIKVENLPPSKERAGTNNTTTNNNSTNKKKQQKQQQQHGRSNTSIRNRLSQGEIGGVFPEIGNRNVKGSIQKRKAEEEPIRRAGFKMTARKTVSIWTSYNKTRKPTATTTSNNTNRVPKKSVPVCVSCGQQGHKTKGNKKCPQYKQNLLLAKKASGNASEAVGPAEGVAVGTSALGNPVETANGPAVGPALLGEETVGPGLGEAVGPADGKTVGPGPSLVGNLDADEVMDPSVNDQMIDTEFLQVMDHDVALEDDNDDDEGDKNNAAELFYGIDEEDKGDKNNAAEFFKLDDN